MKLKTKILFVSHEASIGGSTVSLMSLIQGLKEKTDLEIKVLLPSPAEKAAKFFCEKQISYKTIWYRRNYKMLAEKYSLKYRIFDFLNGLAVIRIYYYIKKEKIDIVCSNSTGVDVGARAAEMANLPHIYYVREFMQKDFNCEYRNKNRMRNLLENSEYVIFISKAVEEYYKSNYEFRNTSQFFNGFIVKDYYIQEHEILTNKELSFIQVGEFSEGKGVLNTIEILYNLNKNGIKNWKMEFVGKGTDDNIKKMQNLISKYHLESKITIGDFCLNMKEKLSEKDILIMNSRAEGFGRVTVEGMLAGCLVIGKNSGGTKEIIEDKVSGVLFENENDFIDIIEQIDNERDTYKKLAKNGQKYALEKFDCANTARNFMNIIVNCVNISDNALS